MDLHVDRTGDCAVITVSGEIDVESGYLVYLAAVKEAENGSGRVVLDLADVTFLDSVGLGMLIRSRHELDTEHRSVLALRNPSSRVTSLLQMTGLSEQFTPEA